MPHPFRSKHLEQYNYGKQSRWSSRKRSSGAAWWWGHMGWFGGKKTKAWLEEFVIIRYASRSRGAPRGGEQRQGRVYAFEHLVRSVKRG